METKHRKIENYKRDENHHNWKGDDVGYTALHEWVSKKISKPVFCPKCKKKRKLELSNKGIYNRDLKNWEWLCRKCHINKDGRNHKGEKNGRAKLNSQKVLEIREKYNTKDDYTKIGKKYKVSYWTISQIINRKLWKHI